MSAAVRLHVLSTGSMTTALGGFLEGEEGSITFPVPVFVVEHGTGLVVVDAGLHPDLATSTERLGRLGHSFQVHLPSDGSGTLGPVLEVAGFDPAAVTHSILTHLHFDHVGGLFQLPNARVLVQRREWSQVGDERSMTMGSYDPRDVDLGHERIELDGDHDVFGDDTVTCLLTDGHTCGHQSVRIRTETGTFVVCGDCCYLRRSFTHQHLPPFAFDRDRQRASIRRLAAEHVAGATLLFGHDPDQFEAIARTGLQPEL